LFVYGYEFTHFALSVFGVENQLQYSGCKTTQISSPLGSEMTSGDCPFRRILAMPAGDTDQTGTNREGSNGYDSRRLSCGREFPVLVDMTRHRVVGQ
jgi:hypothetical protein